MGFRFYWLNRKLLEDNDQCLQRSNVNPYIFTPLKHYSTDKESLQNVLMDPNFPGFDISLDGLLFYHNMLNYMPGHTPLVGWLKGYMVPEMLGIHVSSKIDKQKPPTYSSMEDHITEFEAKYFKEKEKRKINEKLRDEEKTKEKSFNSSSLNADFQEHGQVVHVGDNMDI